MVESAPSLGKLKLWQRVPVRLTLIYGTALLLVLTPAAYVVYRLAVQAELDNLYARIHTTSVSLAAMVDGDELAVIRTADAPYRTTLIERFSAIVKREPELASIYVFAPTAKREEVRFVVDVDVRKKPGAFGELYDATRYPELLRGLVEPAVEKTPVADAWGLSVSGFAPVRDATGQPIAILGVDVDAARIERMKENLRLVAIVAYLAALVLLALAALGVAKMLRGPLAKMIRGTGAIAEGRLDARVGVLGRDEFGVLGHHFDVMASGLEEREHIRQTFGRYVSEEVAKKLLANRGSIVALGEERHVTVMFSDLRGYSTLSEHLAPTEVLRLMNEYLELMNQVIVGHGGCVIEYTGDGILAVFGAPDDLPQHEERAVRSAFAMRDSLEALNTRWDADGTSAMWKSRGIEHLTARLGLHSGPVVAGSLGSRVRMKYTILGDTVNLAARLERLNTTLGTDILVSKELFEALPDDLRTRGTARGAHLVKGRETPVSVYSF